MTVLDEQMTERELAEFVRAAAATFGWWRHHHYDSRRSSPGWPDEVLLRPPEMIVAELKSEKGKVSGAQRSVLDALAACGVEVHVWRPSDLDSILARLARSGQ